MTAVKLILLVVVCIAGYTQGSTQWLLPFTDSSFGGDGIFMGASLVFFTFAGFDAIGNAAEEVRLPERVFVCVQREDTDTLAYIAWWTGVGERGAGGLPMCPVVTLPQVRHVAHLPWALVGTVGVSAVLYILLALALALMVFPSIACPDLAFFTPQASFITAFVTHCTSSACWADAFADVLAPDSLFFLHP